MSKKEKVLVFTNIITVILLIALGGVLVFSKDKEETKKDEVQECTDVKETKIEGKLIYSNYSEDNKIYLKTDNTLELISKDLGNKVIAEKVNKTYDIQVGQSDVCEGNRWIVALTDDNQFIAISIDAMSCGDEIKTLNVSDEMAKLELNDTIAIYTTETFTNQFEPTAFKVFALNEDGESTEITSIFEN